MSHKTNDILYALALAVMGLLILGGALFWALLVWHEKQIPPSLTLMLGLAIPQVAQVLQKRQTEKAMNGISESASQAETRASEILERIDSLERKLSEE